MGHFQYLSQRYHSKKSRAVTTAGKGGYKVVVQNIYGIPPLSPEEHHEAIENLNNIVQVMQIQSYELEGMPQENTLLTRSNSDGMAESA